VNLKWLGILERIKSSARSMTG